MLDAAHCTRGSALDSAQLSFSATASPASSGEAVPAPAADSDEDVYCAVLGRHSLAHASSSECFTVQLTALTGAMFAFGVARRPLNVNALPNPLPTTVYEGPKHRSAKQAAAASASSSSSAAAPASTEGEFWVYCPLARSKTHTRGAASGKPTFYGPQTPNPALNLAAVISPAPTDESGESASSSEAAPTVTASASAPAPAPAADSKSAPLSGAAATTHNWRWTVECDVDRGTISFYEPDGLCLGAAFVNIPNLHECVPFATVCGTGFALRFDFDRPPPLRPPLPLTNAKGRVVYMPPPESADDKSPSNKSRRWIPVPIEQAAAASAAAGGAGANAAMSKPQRPPRNGPAAKSRQVKAGAAAAGGNEAAVKIVGDLGRSPKAQRQPKPKTAADLAKKQAAHKLVKLHPGLEPVVMSAQSRS